MKKLLCIIGIIFATMMSTTAFAEMFSFQSVLGVNDISDIQSAVIVGDNGKCADIEQEDLQQWLNVYWNFQGYEPVILPQSNNGYYYILHINIWFAILNFPYITHFLHFLYTENTTNNFP